MRENEKLKQSQKRHKVKLMRREAGGGLLLLWRGCLRGSFLVGAPELNILYK
jgi:lipoate-protein ligase A